MSNGMDAMKQRFVTALVALIITLLGIFFRDPSPVIIMATLCVYFAAEEIWAMFFKSRSIFPILMSALFGASIYGIYQQHDKTLILWFLLGIYCLSVGLILAMMRWKRGDSLLAPAMTWVMAPIAGLLILHLARRTGHDLFVPSPVLMALVPVWAGDTAAIFAGRAFGKRPLWPAISPKKTWEGAFAHLAAALVAATALAPALGYSWTVGILCGLFAGILGQYGDLFESALKRNFDTKDSGGLFPGHGGVLDRLDSMLMPALPITVVLLFMT